jgi:hypothetical protein
MADFFQQNWIGIAFVAAMLAMHLGGRRRGGHSGGMHGGCGAGQAGHSTRDRAQQADDGSRPPPPSPSTRASAESASDVGRPDPTRDAVNPDDDELVRGNLSRQYWQPSDRNGTERRISNC